MKGALGILVICGVIWVFWMSWEWLRNRNKKRDTDKYKNKKK